MRIALIGMPTSGKSTISNLVVSIINYQQIDLDHMLEDQFGMTLQEYINSNGEDDFLEQENRLMMDISYPDNCIISTGGSVVYASEAMDFLKSIGVHFVYLKTPIKQLEKRLKTQRDVRGIVMRGSNSWAELLSDRDHLYSKYADTVINTDGLSLKDISQKIVNLI